MAQASNAQAAASQPEVLAKLEWANWPVEMRNAYTAHGPWYVILLLRNKQVGRTWLSVSFFGGDVVDVDRDYKKKYPVARFNGGNWSLSVEYETMETDGSGAGTSSSECPLRYNPLGEVSGTELLAGYSNVPFFGYPALPDGRFPLYNISAGSNVSPFLYGNWSPSMQDAFKDLPYYYMWDGGKYHNRQVVFSVDRLVLHPAGYYAPAAGGVVYTWDGASWTGPEELPANTAHFDVSQVVQGEYFYSNNAATIAMASLDRETWGFGEFPWLYGATSTIPGVIDTSKLPEKVITTPDAAIPLEDFYSKILAPDGAIDGTYIGVLVGGLTDVANPPVDGDTDKPEVVPGVGLTYADVVKALETVFPKTSIKEEDFKQNPAIARKFPFCIPWDVVDVFRCLSAEPEAPVFKLNFYIPSMHIDEEVVLDLAPFAPVARTGRTMLLLLLIFGLALSTRSLIRG